MKIIERFILAIIIFLMIAPSLAHGDLLDFRPRIYETEAELAADAFYRSDKKTSSDTADLDRKHIFFSERFIFTANGWSYHPRFIVFLTKLGLGVNQDYLTGNYRGLDESWTTSMVHEYEFRALILPEHPYNLEVFTLRNNPYITGNFTRGVETVSRRTGAVFQYKQQPYKYRLSYTMSTLESRRYTTDTDALSSNASYTKEWGSLAGAYSRTDSDTSFARVTSKSTLDKYSLGNHLRFFGKKVYLTSNINFDNLEQKDSFREFDNRRFSWTENLNIDLPWGFDTQLYHNYFKDESKSRELGTGRTDELWSKSNTSGISIQHKLYHSLTTNYNFNYFSNRSSIGDAKGTSQSISSSYIKKIPKGILNAGISLGRSVVDRTGSPVSINQSFVLRISEQFELPSDVDEASIRILVRDDETGVFMVMDENIHFLVLAGGFVQIIGVPDDALNPDPFHEYTFQVTYALVPDDVEIQTDAYGYSLKLHLFDYFFTPYYSHSHSEQKILSGSLSGRPNETTTDIIGVLFQKNPYSLELQHIDTDSTVRSSKKYRVEAKYRNAITPTTQLNVRAYYTRSYITANFLRTSDSYTENFFGTEAHLQKRFPKKNLTVSLGGIYSRTTGIIEATRYFADASLLRHMGKLQIRAGMKIGSLITEQDGRRESFNQFYYLSLRRRLF